MSMEPIVYVVDDDSAMAESLSWIIQSIGLKVKTFIRAQDFMDQFDPYQHGCLLLDVRMPGMSGPELQTKLNSESPQIPFWAFTKDKDGINKGESDYKVDKKS